VTAVSSYIAYARALNRLGWTPAEFVVAESFAVRLRGMLGRCPVAANGLPLVMAFPRCSSVHTCFMAYPIDIAFIDRDGNILACYENVRPWRMCSHRTRAPFNHCFDPCSPTRAGLRIGDSGLSSYEIG
jgi:hypothetical protein